MSLETIELIESLERKLTFSRGQNTELRLENDALRKAVRDLLTAAGDFMGDYAAGPPDSLHNAWRAADSLINEIKQEEK